MKKTTPIPSSLKEGTKFDQEKVRYDLLSQPALDALAAVATYGGKKYADHNWRKGILFSRYFSAAMRHLWAFWRGEDIDPESGLPHLAHAMWNCMALYESSIYRKKYDDRYKLQDGGSHDA